MPRSTDSPLRDLVNVAGLAHALQTRIDGVGDVEVLMNPVFCAGGCISSEASCKTIVELEEILGKISAARAPSQPKEEEEPTEDMMQPWMHHPAM